MDREIDKSGRDLRLNQKMEVIISLAEELGKRDPNLVLVKKQMIQVGLAYSSDPVVCLERVLQAIDRDE